MVEFIKIFVIILLVFGSAFFLINIKYYFTGKEFSGTCSSNNEYGGCEFCEGQETGECSTEMQEYITQLNKKDK